MPLPYDITLLDYFSRLERRLYIKPLNLGGFAGSGGGIGGPPGGFIGRLSQNRVTYDTDELATSGIPTLSAASLVDNLNHIRYRLETLENGSLIVQEDGTVVASGVQIINFTGDIEVSTIPSGVTVAVTGSGGGSNYKAKVSLNDTTENYLEDKIIAGSNITIVTLNDGSNETLEISATGSGGGGASDFLSLTDTPSSFVTYSGAYVAVNDAETALEFKTTEIERAFFYPAHRDGATGYYQSLGSGSAGSYVAWGKWKVPDNYVEMLSATVYLNQDASITDQYFTMRVKRTTVGNTIASYDDSITTGTYSTSGTNILASVDVTTLFDNVSPGDLLGMAGTKSINQACQYLGYELVYRVNI